MASDDVVKVITQQSIPKTKTSNYTISLLHSPENLLDLTVEEARGFAFFREKTVFDIQGAFHSSFWEQLVLQISHQEPAILHAAVAVGIVHRDQSTTQVVRQNAYYHGLDRRQATGLGQYVKAIEHLRTRIDGVHEAGNERANEVAMMCCLLFICLEMLWGKQMTALTHLGTGLKILTSRQAQGLGKGNKLVLKPRSDDLVDHLSSCFARLDCESTMFGQRAPHLHVLPSGAFDHDLYIPSTFESIFEARRYMDILSSGILRYRGKLLEVASKLIPDTPFDPLSRFLWDHASTRTIDLSDHPLLFSEFGRLRDNLAVWLSALKAFKIIHRDQLQMNQSQSLILLELQYFYAHFLISTSQTKKEIICDSFNHQFKNVVKIAKQYQDNICFESTPPVFALDSGILPALYLTAYKCRCPRTRRDAIALMAQAPCQEGLWDGKVLAKFMTQVVELEESRAEKPVLKSDDIDEVARCSDILVLFHSEKVGWGRLVCARYCHESDGRLAIWEQQFKLPVE